MFCFYFFLLSCPSNHQPGVRPAWICQGRSWTSWGDLSCLREPRHLRCFCGNEVPLCHPKSLSPVESSHWFIIRWPFREIPRSKTYTKGLSNSDLISSDEPLTPGKWKRKLAIFLWSLPPGHREKESGAFSLMAMSMFTLSSYPITIVDFCSGEKGAGGVGHREHRWSVPCLWHNSFFCHNQPQHIFLWISMPSLFHFFFFLVKLGLLLEPQEWSGCLQERKLPGSCNPCLHILLVFFFFSFLSPIVP